MVKVMAMEDAAAAMHVQVYNDVQKALTEVQILKANILGLIDQETEAVMPKLDFTWNKTLKEKVAAKLDASCNKEEEGIVKAYRDFCKAKKELYVLDEELLQWIKVGIKQEKLAHTMKEMKKLMVAYKDICKLSSETCMKMMIKESAAPGDVHQLLRNVSFWLKTGIVRLACSLGNLSIRTGQQRYHQIGHC